MSKAAQPLSASRSFNLKAIPGGSRPGHCGAAAQRHPQPRWRRGAH
ncbi:hypothetical protein TGAMA5MH_09705 [Trichoderma gamsii]|uniref:Uncharacterized protein n=1 Tax=Trichoderma gamsii TaxID=398673 RepID=A0A2K0SYI8_9HYPO|nr:hypothetical protein TGAMA5MH_09705 [Trichoderma gamsii]